MNNLIGLIILAGAVSRLAGTMQRRFLAPLPPAVIASGTQAEPGEFPRTERRESSQSPPVSLLPPLWSCPRESVLLCFVCSASL